MFNIGVRCHGISDFPKENAVVRIVHRQKFVFITKELRRYILARVTVNQRK